MSLRVLVRIKPSSCLENVVAHKVSHTSVVIRNPVVPSSSITYTFDQIFGADVTTSEIFHTLKDDVGKTFNGINVSIIAHGATGSGKTHTLFGQEDAGLALLSIQMLSEMCVERNCTLHISALEIYNEKVWDLLTSEKQDLNVYDAKKAVLVKGLSEVDLRDEGHFLSMIVPAIQRRHTAATKLNSKSSRGHTLLIVKVVSQQLKTTGKLIIADLAGSENNTLTGNTGDRLQESQKINSSLFAFSLVLEAINKKQKSIPYRNSKLTRLLKDSVGGSSLSTIIATINPSLKFFQATHQTLSFSCKASKVVNVVSTHPSTPGRFQHHGSLSAQDTSSISMSLSSNASLRDEVPMTPAFHQTPNKVPVGFSPFVRTIVGRLQRIEDKLEEQSIALKDVTSLNIPQFSLCDSPSKQMKMDVTATRNEVVSDLSSKGPPNSFDLSFQGKQPTADRSEPERQPFFSIPFLANRKVSKTGSSEPPML
jgi:kinesin family protein 22